MCVVAVKGDFVAEEKEPLLSSKPIEEAECCAPKAPTISQATRLPRQDVKKSTFYTIVISKQPARKAEYGKQLLDLNLAELKARYTDVRKDGFLSQDICSSNLGMAQNDLLLRERMPPDAKQRGVEKLPPP